MAAPDVDDVVNEAIEKFQSAANIAHDVSNGPEGATVASESGPIPTLLEWQKRNEVALGGVPALTAEVNTLSQQILDLLSTAVGKGVDLIGNGAPVIRASKRGCVAGQEISAQLQAAAIEADARGFELMLDIPNAIISNDVVLPQRFNGMDCILTGTGWIISRARRRCKLGFFSCTNLLTEGLFHSHIRNIEVTQEWIIGGYDANFGFFYNFVCDVNAGWITVDVSKQAVNGNTFQSCGAHDPTHYGLTVTDRGATSSLGIMEYHANNWPGHDFSHSLGTRNLIQIRKQTNGASGYNEHGSNIRGLYHVGVMCSISDGQSGPIVGMHNHVLGMTDVNPPAWGDSLSASVNNVCAGGDWMARDATGKPACFSASYAAQVISVTSSPYGYKAVYGGTATGAGHSLSVTVEPSFDGFFAVDVFINLPEDQLPVAIAITSAGTGDSYRNPADVTALDGHFYKYRFSGKVLPGAGATISLFLTNSSITTCTAYLGAAFGTHFKAAFSPSYSNVKPAETTVFNGSEIKRGEVGQSYTSGGTSFDKTITYGQPFPAGVTTVPIVEVIPSSTYEGKISKIEILSRNNAGFVARFYYTVDWTGTILWAAFSK